MPDTITRLENRQTGQTLAFLASADQTAGRYLEIESSWRGHSVEPAAHYHPSQTETFTVRQGTLTIRLNGQVRQLQAGEQLVIRPGEVHSMWNAGDEIAVANWKTEPALRTEEFLRTMFGLAHDGHTGPSGAPPFLQAALTVRRYTAEFRLVKPSRLVQQLVFGGLGAIARLRGMRAVYPQYQRPTPGG